MNQALITSIIVASFGALLGVFWNWSQAALARERATTERNRIEEKMSAEKSRVEDRDGMKETLNRIQFSIDAQTKTHRELSDAINKVSSMFDKLNLTLQMVEKDSSNRFRELENRLDILGQNFEVFRNHDMEQLRARDHELFTFACAMRLQGELKNTWTFKNDWKLPYINQVRPPMDET